MDVHWLALAQGLGIALALIVAVLLIAQLRRQPADLVGRVKADAYLAMLRATIALLAGLGLLRAAGVSLDAQFQNPLRWAGAGLVLLGGTALIARSLLYIRRVKPDLDQLQTSFATTQRGEDINRGTTPPLTPD